MLTKAAARKQKTLNSNNFLGNHLSFKNGPFLPLNCSLPVISKYNDFCCDFCWEKNWEIIGYNIHVIIWNNFHVYINSVKINTETKRNVICNVFGYLKIFCLIQNSYQFKDSLVPAGVWNFHTFSYKEFYRQVPILLSGTTLFFWIFLELFEIFGYDSWRQAISRILQIIYCHNCCYYTGFKLYPIKWS